MKPNIRFFAVVLAVLTAALCACGGKSYGSQSLAQVTPGGSSNYLDVPTPSPTQHAVSMPPPGSTPPAQQQQPPPQAPPQQKVTIKIQNDSQAATGYFSPSGVAIEHGTLVVFVNTDSVARSVVSTSGPSSFNSGPIAPGQSWSHTFSTPGDYQFQDGTRPYATGEVQVH